MKKIRISSKLTAIVALLTLPGMCALAEGAAIARTDAEIVLRIDGITPEADVEITGRGSRQVGLITPAVNDSFNRVRIAGIVPADNDPVPMGLGDSLELDGQSDVRTDTLSIGESAELLIELFGQVDITNENSFDVTINFFYEREYFLTAGTLGTPDPATERALSRGTFEILGQSFDELGSQADEFSRSFDQFEVYAASSNPEEKFNFDFVVPAGGTVHFDMTATAYSRMALVPEPASLLLGTMAVLGVGWFRRGRRTGQE